MKEATFLPTAPKSNRGWHKGQRIHGICKPVKRVIYAWITIRSYVVPVSICLWSCSRIQITVLGIHINSSLVFGVLVVIVILVVFRFPGSPLSSNQGSSLTPSLQQATNAFIRDSKEIFLRVRVRLD